MAKTKPSAEAARLAEDATRAKNWKRWGPYLSERQWGTVREDYSPDGSCWNYFTHDQARSRAYRWGEDGLLGFCDREGRLNFALAFWNEKDPILKERLFGLTALEGNHGEDVKEEYFYLDATPTYSYCKGLYKYPQAEYPYKQLVDVNHQRTRDDPEFELADTGIFENNKYWDVFVEYAKAGPDDVLIRIRINNRGPVAARLHVLPTFWFRNSWSWGDAEDVDVQKPRMSLIQPGSVRAWHQTLGDFQWHIDRVGAETPPILFTENETNFEKIWNVPNGKPWVKDAFNEYVVHGNTKAVNDLNQGTKAGAHCILEIPAGGETILRLRLSAATDNGNPFDESFDEIFAQRIAEADEFYDERIPEGAGTEGKRVSRQAYAGLLWSRQFYNYVVDEWLHGDPGQPPPPSSRLNGRNSDWSHIYSRDVLSMPDKWEYPWFAAWDLAFHMIPLCRLDPELAKEQMLLMLREWYMHPNGKLPAYEFAFDDVNPPVHAWACWRIYKMTAPRGERDVAFLARAFQKLLMNFTWWVNRKDVGGKHIFAGGFLGLDNIGLFDRSQPLPMGGRLEQADGTAWMAFYCDIMLQMALELAVHDPVYEDIASKFFEHFVAIVDAMNTLGGAGLWDEEDGFYYDQIQVDNQTMPLRVRSMVGLIPLMACDVLEESKIQMLKGFAKRTKWFIDHRPDLAKHISYLEPSSDAGQSLHLLAIPSKDRLIRVLKYVLDENEFLSPHGIRSLSRYYLDNPYVFKWQSMEYTIQYMPAESRIGMFGGNSNWRGPVWMPVNFLLIEALERYHHFYGDDLKVECPTGSGVMMNLREVAAELSRRLTMLFLPDKNGQRAFTNGLKQFDNPAWNDLVLFYEYFDGDTGRGVGASHQTGWTALITRLLEKTAPKLPKRLRKNHAQKTP
jgi:Glycosyl hydrolase family 63 C-terminal domain